jgi:DNA invertase Pin-like site-specific DNA recombinase
VSQDRSEGKSVDDQLAECRAWAQRAGWQVIVEHRDDGISASRYANGKVRPGWQSVMDLITVGQVDILCVWEVSELAGTVRSGRHYWQRARNAMSGLPPGDGCTTPPIPTMVFFSTSAVPLPFENQL